MYALIYDQFEPAELEKEVISVHKTRKTAENALKKRQEKLGRRVWECNTRIVWVYKRVRAGDKLTAKAFDTWAPGEKIPQGDRVPDGD
jgi:hypothetical protein